MGVVAIKWVWLTIVPVKVDTYESEQCIAVVHAPLRPNSQFIASNIHEGGRSLFIIHYCYCIVKLTLLVAITSVSHFL